MRKIRNFFYYLFYKYYLFQVRIGNADVASFFSTLIITFISFLYVAIIFMIIVFFIIPQSNINVNPKFGIVILIIFFIPFYFLFLFKSKYKEIIKIQQSNHKNNIWPILLPMLAFILINVCWILKMFQNQGKI
ncbi:hypothetical protein [Epilithonimonas zeae]|uniref:hypothetical protein n=1 Tax=Epilithonimonas zeae TaxID=1416779 RepID=UPI00200F6774|nr:hypothetical protein [Epilithonimonas zeae]UQB67783.1 hypothetical protein KI430_12155 [Epilithonimonas zeae]